MHPNRKTFAIFDTTHETGFEAYILEVADQKNFVSIEIFYAIEHVTIRVIMEIHRTRKKISSNTG